MPSHLGRLISPCIAARSGLICPYLAVRPHVGEERALVQDQSPLFQDPLVSESADRALKVRANAMISSKAHPKECDDPATGLSSRVGIAA